MDIQKEGELFEIWWENHGQYNRAGGGNYEKTFAWESWIAAKAQAVPEWISVEDQLPPNDPYNREYWVYETLNNKVQHDYWVCPDKELEQEFEPFFNNWLRKVTHWMPMVKYPNPPVQAQEPSSTSDCPDEP